MPHRRHGESTGFSTRVTVGVTLAAILALWGAIQFWGKESAFARHSSDPFHVADGDTRLAGFRDALPADATLGYLTDLPPENVIASSMFLIAQYHLAPRLLQKSASYETVLGNFTRPADFAALGRAQGLRMEHDYGNGVVLFRREARP